MNKVFVLQPGEDWIVDRFVEEWNEDNKDISVKSPHDADVIWLLADWCWDKLPYELLQTKKVITTVHHITPEKFDQNAKYLFFLRDKITDVYHTYNEITYNFVKQLTDKPVQLIYYWANQKIWKKTEDKASLRKRYNLPDQFLIGSFQRDTEGFDLKSPKLEKGPDLLVDYIEYKKSLLTCKEVHVVLAGWRRQYVIKRLTDANIEFSYFERPSHAVINDLYQCLDLYPIASRCEGGPQSLIECGLLDVPVVSRDVGISRQVLPMSSINNDLRCTSPSIPDVSGWKLPMGYAKYRELILSL